MGFRHHDHRDVAVRESVCQRPKKSDDLTVFNRNQRHLGARDELAELVSIRHATIPAAGDEKMSGRFEL